MSKLGKLVNQIVANYQLFQLRRDQWKNLEELKKKQLKRLKAIIKHAYYNVPFYHKAFLSLGIRPDDIKTFEDLKKLPIVSKNDIQKNYEKFITAGIDVSKLPSRITSGSTGIPLKLISDPQPSPGTSKYPFFECGVKPFDKFVTVWGRGAQQIKWGSKYEWLWGEVGEIVVPLLFPEEKLIKILQMIKPDVLLTFPSILLMLANYELSGITPRLIFTQGEMVTSHCRDLVPKKFNVDLFETYGCVEFGTLAFECPQHSGLHVLTNNAYLEFIDESGDNVSQGERGEIIVTGLYNFTMPLIRYRLGDIGIPSDERCPCGRSWPLIRSIEGRINDFLILRDGKKISWLYLLRYLLYDEKFKENIYCVSQYQLVQERFDRIVFKIVKGAQFEHNILEGIKNKIEVEFAKQGYDLEIVLEYVDEIPIERTGKRRLFISKINQA
jgi:phenylacetate-CoA ligase